MSANPANPNLQPSLEPSSKLTAAQFPSSAIAAPGHEALQALLAFSSLHEQIRRRQKYAGFTEGQDPWKFEQFVLDEVLQLVAERALAITGSDGVAIALAEGDAIICRASAGEIAPDAGARLDPNSGFSGVCFRTGKIVRCDDVESDPRVNVPAARRLGVRSMVAVPLAGQRGNIGLIEAFSHDAYGFNDSDIRNLNLLAELILAAMKPEEENRLAEISQKVVGQVSEAKAPGNHLPSIEELRTELRPAGRADKVEQAEISQTEHVPFAVEDPAQTERNKPGLKLIVVLMVVAVAIGTGLWWKLRPSTSTAAVQNPTPASTKAPQTPAANDASPAVDSSTAPDSGQPDLRKDGLTLVTGVRHWSSPDSTTVVVDLHHQVQYETHRLSDPNRIYFDLHNTALAPGLFGKSFEIGDAFLARVRIAQPMKGVTRVVLETTSDQDVPVASMQSNPYRLVVEIKKAGVAGQPKAKVDLFAPPTLPLVTHQAAQSRAAAIAPKQLQQPEPSKAQVQTHAPAFRVALDAGHGGWDKGTVGRRGLMEKDLALDIVSRLGDMLSKRLRADVVYTRQDDTYIALEKRAEIANVAQADLFVSVHANYSDMPSARGVETYYTNTYSSLNARTPGADANLQNISWTGVDIRHKTIQSQQLAASVQGALYGKLAPGQAEFQNRGVRKAPYVVLTGTTMPAVLAEVSFVSSPTDEKNLKNPAYRQRIAEALFKGISRYAASLHRVTMASAAGKPSGR